MFARLLIGVKKVKIFVIEDFFDLPPVLFTAVVHLEL
jgi:hypothetical protein